MELTGYTVFKTISYTFCPKLRILVKYLIMIFEKKSHIYVSVQKLQMVQKGIVQMLYYGLLCVPEKPKD